MTGITFVSNVLGAKRVQLLRDLAPRVGRIALLMNPDNPNAAAERADSQAGAAKLGCETIALDARNAGEIDKAFVELVRARADAVIAATDPVMLARLATTARLSEEEFRTRFLRAATRITEDATLPPAGAATGSKNANSPSA